MVPPFIANLHASHLVEAIDTLGEIGARATGLASERAVEFAYPPSAPQTPEVTPRGRRQKDEAGAWQHPTWQLLGLSFETPHFFSFGFDSELGAERSSFTAYAHGDLDGDGHVSTFEIQGASVLGHPPLLLPIRIEQEYE